MTLEEFYATSLMEAAFEVTGSACRKGQALANSLYRHRPDISDEISDTDADPFFSDANIGPCWDKIKELW